MIQQSGAEDGLQPRVLRLEGSQGGSGGRILSLSGRTLLAGGASRAAGPIQPFARPRPSQKALHHKYHHRRHHRNRTRRQLLANNLNKAYPVSFFCFVCFLFLAWPIPSGHDSPTGGGKRAIDPHLVGPLPIAQPDGITQSSPMLLGEVAGHAGREVPMEIVQPRAITENCRYAHKCQRCNDPMHKASSCPN